MVESFQKLNIVWQMPDPPVEPLAWTRVVPGPRSSGSEALGHRLGIGGAGLDCLDAAFKQGLNRFTGWELSEKDHYKAARIFKRGVHWRFEGEVSPIRSLSGQYNVTIVDSKAALLEQIKPYKDWAIIFDEQVAEHWAELADSLQTFTIATSELSKNLMTVAEILEEIEDAPGVVIIGGGVLGDMAGFAAALLNIPMVLIPTTLLAMADACIGGKTGVNYAPHGKNQVGSFYFPEAVIVWDGWLTTLPAREMNAGIAECLKHMFLSGEMTTAEQIAKRHITPYLAEIIGVKAEVVSLDPAEQGVRATLNFGHTLAHALEGFSHQHSLNKKHILHGEAVAVGLAFAILLSHDAGFLEREDMRRMGQILLDAKVLPSKTQLSEMLGTPVDSTQLWQDLLHLISKDKKATGATDSTNWILLDRPGHAVTGPNNNFLIPVKNESLSKTWQALIATL